MSQWFMLTLVGKDQIGIVAKVTTVLYQAGCHLGEASMLRLGGNFTIMLMIHYTADATALEKILGPISSELDLHVHLDIIEGRLHQHAVPDVRISVHGADRAGIVAEVTTTLAQAGLNILNLDSDVGGASDKPFYVMSIEGMATQGVTVIEQALKTLLVAQPDLDVRLEPVDTLVM